MSLAPAQQIGPYRIEALVGTGGMGEVYRATDTRLDRTVALKALPADKFADVERKRRFLREAKSASALNHPNIITIHDILSVDGSDFLVMEYLPGRTLDHFITKKGISIPEALQYAIQIADALAAAHSVGIVHRDLKPANVMVSDNGSIKLLDFGLATFSEAASKEGDITRSIAVSTEGVIAGTVPYMSPEQAEGKTLDARSDIFSFGCVLYEMFTGQRAFRGSSSISILSAILKEEPQSPRTLCPQLPLPLERIIQRCLRKGPAKRFQCAGDLKLALEDIASEPESASAPIAPPAQQQKLLWTAAALLTMLVIAASFWIGRRTNAGTGALAILRAVPLTSDPGDETSPSFSPDGSQIVYSATEEASRNANLYILALATRARLRLTTDQSNDIQPHWSPDGKWIAFEREGSGIFLVSPLGGAQRRVADMAVVRSMSWMPDSARLLVSGKVGRPMNPIIRFSLIDIETGAAQVVLETESKNIEPQNSRSSMAVAANGRTVAVGTAPFTQGELPIIRLYSLIGGPKLVERSTIPLPSTAGLAGLVFLHGDKQLVLAARQNEIKLFRLGLSDARFEELPITADNGFAPALNAQGNKLAFVHFNNDENLYKLRLKYPGEPDGDPIPFAVSTARDSNPNISGDGSKVTFGSYRTGTPEIYVCDLNGSNLVKLTSMRALIAGSSRFSPDGKWVVFDSRPAGASAEIYLLPSDGGPLRKLTDNPAADTVPTWSQDGRYIYFHSDRSGASQVWKMKADGTDPVQVTHAGGHLAFASSDDRTIFYTKTDGFNTAIWTTSATGGQETPVLDGVYRHNFSVTRTGIYYSTQHGVEGGPEVLYYRFADRSRRTVYRLKRPVGLGVSVAPDETWLLFSQLDGSGSDLMLVENFQ